MAEATATDEKQGNSAKRGGGGKLGWIVTAVVAGALGAGVPYVLPANLQPGHGAAPNPDAKAETPPSPAVEVKPAYIEFGDVVVNLAEGRISRFIKLNITLQVKENERESINTSVQTQKAVLRNWLISYLSDQTIESVQGRIGQNRLRREIRDQFNTVLFPDGYDRIDDILFQEFAIQ